jgi:ArsR family transcriptional regulator, arsenate/arsenite/antimonite-responsive transcriptional repressor
MNILPRGSEPLIWDVRQTGSGPQALCPPPTTTTSFTVIQPSFHRHTGGVAATMQDVGTAKTTTPAISPLAGEPIKRADAERLAGVLKAFADPARLRLLSLIQSAPEGEASVTDLTAPLGLSQPTVSHHLRILTEAGLLEREKRGVWAYYRLVPSAIAAIADLLTPPRKRATKKTR